MNLDTYQCNVPVLFIIFNRIDTTREVLNKIKSVKPPKIYIAADGPRTPKESTICAEVKELVLNNIDWNPEVFTLFQETNIGCRLNVSGAISWFFRNEEKGIILEDDCLPTTSFFFFCENLLNKYQFSPEIMHISGTNSQDGMLHGNATYYFSAISHIWGWASWRRAWDQYDLHLSGLDNFIKDKVINNIFDSFSPRFNFIRVLKQIKRSKNASTWDFQWTFSIMRIKGICITPNYNLVSNIGYGPQSTHSWDSTSIFARRPTIEINSISHPTEIKTCSKADNYEGKTIYAIPAISYIIKKILNKISI